MTSAMFDDAGEAARFADYRIAQMHEYGQWVATGPIYIDGVLAFTEDHPVPASTVAKFGLDKQNLVRPADSPPPSPERAREERKRARLAALDAERARLAAELGDGSTVDADDESGGDKPAKPATKSARGKAGE